MRYWIMVCAVFDVLAAGLVVKFGAVRDLYSWHGIEWLLAVPFIVFCLGWWLCLSLGIRRFLPARLAWLDWRISVILIVTLLSVAATLIGFAFDLNDEAKLFVKDVFAGWVASVAFFGLVGIVVSVASLVNAAEDQFDARARVLVRGRAGGHIDNFIEQLRTTLAHYAASVTRSMTVTEYDAATSMYKVLVDVTTVIRSYVDDIETRYASSVSYKPDFPPPVGRHHRLIRLTGVDCDPTPIESATADPIHRPYTAIVARGAECTVEFVLEIWVKATVEPITYSPVRYSLITTVKIDNQLQQAVPVRSGWLSERPSLAAMPAGSAPRISSQADLKSGNRVHTLFLDPPP